MAGSVSSNAASASACRARSFSLALARRASCGVNSVTRAPPSSSAAGSGIRRVLLPAMYSRARSSAALCSLCLCFVCWVGWRGTWVLGKDGKAGSKDSIICMTVWVRSRASKHQHKNAPRRRKRPRQLHRHRPRPARLPLALPPREQGAGRLQRLVRLLRPLLHLGFQPLGRPVPALGPPAAASDARGHFDSVGL